MSLACDNPQKLMEDVEHLQVDVELLRQFVNGGVEETVQIGEGAPTPTIRKLVHDIDERESRAAELVIGQGLLDQIAIRDNARKEMAEQVNKAKAEVEKIRGLSVRAYALSEEKNPTAVYIPDTGRLVLGIPSGKTGATGPMGPAGIAPTLGVLDFGGPELTQIFVIDGGDPDTFRNPPVEVPDFIINLDNGLLFERGEAMFAPADKSGVVSLERLIVAMEA